MGGVFLNNGGSIFVSSRLDRPPWAASPTSSAAILPRIGWPRANGHLAVLAEFATKEDFAGPGDLSKAIPEPCR